MWSCFFLCPKLPLRNLPCLAQLDLLDDEEMPMPAMPMLPQEQENSEKWMMERLALEECLGYVEG